MARTYKQPIRIGPHGGVAWLPTEHPELATRQVIALSLIPGDTRHPWDRKDRLAAPSGIFRIGRAGGELVAFIIHRFEQLELDGRAQLVGRPQVIGPDASGKRTVIVRYRDLETGQDHTEGVTL